MMKYICIAVLALLFAGSWFWFYQSGGEIRELTERIEEQQNLGDPGEEVPTLKTELSSKEGPRVFSGILLVILTAGLAGIVFVTWLLPIFAHKLTHSIYDSGEEVEADPYHDARVLVAQGEWDAAIESFKLAAAQDPMNRMPWVEIAKIQRINQEDPAAAVATLREAVEGQEWQENDAAFLMFRLAEIYDENMGDRASASALLEQVIGQFPETRHSANARSKLHEWGMA